MACRRFAYGVGGQRGICQQRKIETIIGCLDAPRSVNPRLGVLKHSDDGLALAEDVVHALLLSVLEDGLKHAEDLKVDRHPTLADLLRTARAPVASHRRSELAAIAIKLELLERQLPLLRRRGRSRLLYAPKGRNRARQIDRSGLLGLSGNLPSLGVGVREYEPDRTDATSDDTDLPPGAFPPFLAAGLDLKTGAGEGGFEGELELVAEILAEKIHDDRPGASLCLTAEAEHAEEESGRGANSAGGNGPSLGEDTEKADEAGAQRVNGNRRGRVGRERSRE